MSQWAKALCKLDHTDPTCQTCMHGRLIALRHHHLRLAAKIRFARTELKSKSSTYTQPSFFPSSLLFNKVPSRFTMSGFANAQGTTLPGLEADRILQHGYDMDAPMAPPPSIPSQLPLNLEISTAKRHRKPKAPTKSKDEWEAHRPHIHRLYVDESLPLAAVMKAMGETYGFHAS